VSTLALGVALATAGGFAYSAIPDAQGLLHGCVNKTTGELRVIDPAAGRECNATSEDPLTWNQQGPKGATGPTGAPGKGTESLGSDQLEKGNLPKGLTTRPKAPKRATSKTLGRAPAKASEAYSTFHDGNVELPGGGFVNPERVVTRLALPSGRWVINAKTLIDSPLPTPTPLSPGEPPPAPEATCSLNAGADYDIAYGSYGTVPLQVVHRFTRPGVVDVRCTRGFLNGPTEVSWTKITAVRVSKLHNKAG
jgi:hypothetical protein